jgi:penicillin-binding protein 1B
VQVVTSDGWVESRSTLHTEYFRKGTQPTSYCPIHSGVWVDTYAGITDLPRPVGDRPSPPMPPAATSGRVSEPSAPAVRPSAPPREQEEVRTEGPKKKRGFWARVFGIDKKNDKKKDEKRKPGGG